MYKRSHKITTYKKISNYQPVKRICTQIIWIRQLKNSPPLLTISFIKTIYMYLLLSVTLKRGTNAIQHFQYFNCFHHLLFNVLTILNIFDPNYIHWQRNGIVQFFVFVFFLNALSVYRFQYTAKLEFCIANDIKIDGRIVLADNNKNNVEQMNKRCQIFQV